MAGESDSSDSWGNLLIDEILIKINQVSGKRSDNRNGNQEHLLVGPKRQKTVKWVSKNVVAKRVVKDLYPKKYTGGNKYLRSAIAPKKDMSAWCAERQANGYGPKIKNSQTRSINSIEKQTNLEIKEEESLAPVKSSEQFPVQTSKTSLIHTTDFIEDKNDFKKEESSEQFPAQESEKSSVLASDIMENSISDKIKFEIPPLSDYNDEGDELKYKQQILEPVKDMTKS